MHTWRLSDKSLLLKIYRTAWPMVNEEKVNFCKLFWGVLFSPVGYLLKLILWPVDKVLAARRKEPLTDAEWLRQYETKQAAKAAKAEARKKSQFYKIASKVLKSLSNFFSKYGETIWLALVSIYVIVIGAALIYWLITDTIATLIAIGIIIGVLAIIALIALIGHNTSLFKKIGSAFKSGWNFLRHGYKSVKYKTCPLIEVTGDPSV